MILESIKDFSDTLIKLDKKIGFRGLLRYSILLVVIIGLFNFKTVVKTGMELVSELQNEIHAEKLIKRDQLLSELLPLLAEFRGYCEAERVLYFEFHNSKENLVGIPFKYMDLVLQVTRYGVIPFPEHKLRDIGSGIIINLYEDIKYGQFVYYKGDNDLEFQRNYSGIYTIFSEMGDTNSSRLFLSIPGKNQPLGIVVIEWLDPKDENKLEKIKEASRIFIPRINGLILSKQ